MHSRSTLLVGVISLLIVAGALGVYLYQKYNNVSVYNPKGVLLLSLAPKGSAEVNLYEYNLATRELRRIGQDGNSNFEGRVSTDGKRIAYISYARSASASQVSLFDPLSLERRTLTRGSGFKHSPDWSPVGSEIAFSAREGSASSRVYAVDVAGTPRRIGAGSYPVWSLDGKSIFALAEEGLVRYDLSKGTSEKVWGAKGVGMKLSASRDHSLVAWLVPSQSRVLLFKGNPASPTELLLNATLEARAYDVAFSSDNAYIALRILTGEGASQHLEIWIERLDTGERRMTLDLSPYESNTAYLSAWK